MSWNTTNDQELSRTPPATHRRPLRYETLVLKGWSAGFVLVSVGSNPTLSVIFCQTHANGWYRYRYHWYQVSISVSSISGIDIIDISCRYHRYQVSVSVSSTSNIGIGIIDIRYRYRYHRYQKAVSSLLDIGINIVDISHLMLCHCVIWSYPSCICKYRYHRYHVVKKGSTHTSKTLLQGGGPSRFFLGPSDNLHF